MKGLKTRYQRTGIAPILIHTVRVEFCVLLSSILTLRSSFSLALVIKYLLAESYELTSIHAGICSDDATGDYNPDVTIIYDDADTERIEAIPDTQVHRNVDLELIEADKEGMLEDSYSPSRY